MSELKTPFKIKYVDYDDIYIVDKYKEGYYWVKWEGGGTDYSFEYIKMQIDEGIAVIVEDDPVCTPEATPDVEQEVLTDLQKRAALINLSGGTLVELTPADECKPIKSDGGSSSYYDIQLPDWLINLIVERRYIKTEELIEVLGNSFNQGNIMKCLVRLNGLLKGGGKEGNSVDYECNKIAYYSNRIKEENSRLK